MEKKPWYQELWYTSDYNFAEEVRRGFRLPGRVLIHDATLRDGEQTPGVVFRREEKVAIARMLDAVGVHRIEAGMPAVSREDAEAIAEISSLGLKAQILAFSRAMKQDVDRAVECGAGGVVLEVPCGYPKRVYQAGWTEEEVIERAVDAINYAKEKDLFVCFFPFDTTRAPLEFIRRLLAEVTGRARPDSVAVIDTTGCASPSAVRHLVSMVKEMVQVPVEVHTHNDLGMATATSLAAVEAGAEVVHVCVNGLGERCGNAPLDEVATALLVLYGLDTGIKLDRLYDLSRLVETASKLNLAPNKALSGELPFMREIGMGMDVLNKHPEAVFAVRPELVGRSPRIVTGKKSGKASIKVKLEELNLNLAEDRLEDLLVAVKQMGIEKKAYLSDEEFAALAAGLGAVMDGVAGVSDSGGTRYGAGKRS